MGVQLNYGSDQAPEYNTPGADSSNGTRGTNSYPAQVNRAQQPGRTGSDPYQNFKNSARMWGSDTPYRPRDRSLDPQQPGASTQPSPTQLWQQAQTNPTTPGGTPASPAYDAAALASTLQGNQGGQAGAPSSTGSWPTGPYAPDPGSAFTDPSKAFGGPLSTPPLQKTSTDPVATPPHPPLQKGNTDPNPGGGPAVSQKGQQAPQKPAGVDDQTWADAQRYVAAAAAQGQDYGFLLQHPEYITEFRNWSGANDPGGTVDIVDYLSHVHPDVPHGLAGRKGYDTMYKFLQTHGTSTGTPGGPGQGAPTTPTGPPAGPPDAPPVPPPPTAPPAPDTSTSGTVDPTQWNGVKMPSVPDDQSIMDLLQKQYNPVYQQGQQDLNKILQGQAALTGDSNSAAYGDVIGQQEGRLIGQQNADLTDKFLTTRENAQNRALSQYQTEVGAGTAKYGIDTNKFVQLVNNDTQRLGIKTNAQLQTYLGQIQAYGINTDAVMKEYTAQLALAGQKYSVDAQVNMNALNAAMQKYGVDTNAQTQAAANATQKYGIDTNAQNQAAANNLGWGQVNLSRYGIDKNAQIQMIHDLVSEGVIDAQTAAQILAGTPGYAYQPAGGG